MNNRWCGFASWWRGCQRWRLGSRLVSALEPIKKESAHRLAGCRKAHLAAFHGTKIAFTCIPWGDAQNTGLSQPASHIRSCMDTHIAIMLDYNKIVWSRCMHSQTCSILWQHLTVEKITIISAYIQSSFVLACAFTRQGVWLSGHTWRNMRAHSSVCKCLCSRPEIIWKPHSVDLPGGRKMMSKRQICIYQQTGILDVTAIQSLSACHVSPRATLPSPKAHGSHASEAALLAYLLPIQRPPPTKKTPEGQNKVSYLWMCQHGTSWNPGCTLSNEPDNSTGAFSSQEKWYLQKHCQDETRSCAAEATKQRGKLVTRRGITQAQLVETQPVTSERREWISNAG